MGQFEKFAKVSAKQIEITVLPETEHDPAFVVQGRVLPDKQISDASERYSDPRTGNLDMKKYRPWWARTHVVGWDGLTANNMRRLIPGVQLDEAKMHAIFGNGAVPYSAEMATDLHQNALQTFAAIINQRLDEERAAMKDAAEEEVRAAQGNLPPGSDSSSM